MTGITDDLDGAASVLLKAPSMSGTRERCTELLTRGLSDPAVLFVSYTRQPSACFDQLADTTVRQRGVITVGDTGGYADRDAVTLRSVSSASDLTGLGIEIGELLSAWEPPIAVCFDSITAMLQYVSFETAYEFLHALAGKLYAADARAHYHIDPAAHDRAQVDGITSLFDAAVDVGEDDTTVRTRDVMA